MNLKQLTKVSDAHVTKCSTLKRVKDSANPWNFAWVSMIQNLGDLLVAYAPGVTEEEVTSELERLSNTIPDDEEAFEAIIRAKGDGWWVVSYNPEGDRWESEDNLPDGMTADDCEEWSADI